MPVVADGIAVDVAVVEVVEEDTVELVVEVIVDDAFVEDELLIAEEKELTGAVDVGTEINLAPQIFDA